MSQQVMTPPIIVGKDSDPRIAASRQASLCCTNQPATAVDELRSGRPGPAHAAHPAKNNTKVAIPPNAPICAR